MRCLVCLLASLLLIGCMPTQKPVTCDEIVNFRAQIGKTFTRESLRAWIHDTYQIPLESIRENTLADGQSLSLHWGDPDRVYYSVTLNQYVIEDTMFGRPQASVGDLTHCLGQPAAYRATYKRVPSGNELGLTLVYPDSGVLAAGTRIFHAQLKQPPSVGTDFPVWYLRFVKPGTTDQVLSEIYIAGWGQANDGILQQYKPWPGNWSDIAVDIDPVVLK